MPINQPTVMVLIPAYNEANLIRETVQAVLELPVITRVLVVDDGSLDQTRRAAESAGAEVISLVRNMGKGAALTRGLAEFREDILVLLDGDLGESAGEIWKLIEPVTSGRADMTIAKFGLPTKKAGFGLVKGLARWGIRCFCGLTVAAPLSGQRALTRNVVENIGGFAAGYGVEVGLTISSVRRGFRVLEVQTELQHEGQTGRDLPGFLHRGRQFFHVLRALFKAAAL